jgi:hypothetical protein
MKKRYITGEVSTPKGSVPRVYRSLSVEDRLGALMVRLGINRSGYRVEPGLYAAGNPDADSLVFATANYKLSFDALRKVLMGIDAWLLVLDTRGINVWCAAGKGTFGTEELVSRISKTNLSGIVRHREIILPQLGAVGVAAHDVLKNSGFSVIYGPVRAKYIPAFLESGMKATPGMRRMNFNLWDRLKLTGVEAASEVKYVVFLAALLYLVSNIKGAGFLVRENYGILLNIIFAFIAGSVAGPVLLPLLPGRAFALKGAFSGLLFFLLSYYLGFTGRNPLYVLAWLFIMLSIASFVMMNFTGASTYTSLSGVRKEMRVAVPMQAAGIVLAIILLIISGVRAG